jgi:hypothetical protein
MATGVGCVAGPRNSIPDLSSTPCMRRAALVRAPPCAGCLCVQRIRYIKGESEFASAVREAGPKLVVVNYSATW